MLLEELKAGLRIGGLIPAEVVTVIAAQWHGSDALELTFKTTAGHLGQQVLFRADEEKLAVAQSGSRAFDASASDFKLVAEAQLLLVRPDIAVKQREAETVSVDHDHEMTKERSGGQGSSTTTSKKPDVAFAPPKTFFYGVKTLNPDKIAGDFKNVADEVLSHLRDTGAELVVRIEIEATDSAGFDESEIRTVSENARTLKFDQSSFEAD